MTRKNRIVTNFWFDTQAEEAAKFYISLFPGGRIVSIIRHGNSGMGPKGSVLIVTFEIDGQRYVGINGGPTVKLNEAASLQVPCDTQEQIDELWDKFMAAGAKTLMCGWLTDEFGLSWQITPAILDEMMADPDEAAADRATAAMLTMVKFDIAELKRAYAGI
jgi:predicted 3-demethylubiquinone-9 3-methyltransferase (glyoxalase superfamily)